MKRKKVILLWSVSIVCLLLVISSIVVWMNREEFAERIRMGKYYGEEFPIGFAPSLIFEDEEYISDMRFAFLQDGDGLQLVGKIKSRVGMDQKPTEDSQINADMVGHGIYRKTGDNDHVYVKLGDDAYRTFVRIELWGEELKKNGF